MPKLKKITKWIAITLVATIFIAFIAFKIYTANYYRADNQIISMVENLLDSQVNSYCDDNGSVFIPEGQDIKAVIVFYPGGKVEYTAYTALMYELASNGYLCLLPKMPENLAILQVNATEVLTSNYQDQVDLVRNLDWYLAGHSLGGVAACSYLDSVLSSSSESGITYSGVILCASYPTADLSDDDIRLLSIYGSEDGVLNMDKYEASKTNWPEDSEEYVIDGGIHSYFGTYGIQDGDGEPLISNEAQIKLTASKIASWINS